MKLATSATGFFQALGDAGVKDLSPFAKIGQSGIKMPGLVPLATGVAAAGAIGFATGGVVGKKQMTKKDVQKVVQKEIKKAKQANTGPGLNGISLFS